MQKLIFRNGNGVEVNLTSGNFGITNWKGFDNAGLNIQSQTVPFTDGSVFIDALLNNRELSVTVALQDNGKLEKRYELKRELIKILNPKLGEGVLTYTNDFLSKQIKVVPSIPIFQNKNSNDKGTQKGTLVFTACNPYWEDTEETVIDLRSGVRQIVENKGDVPCSFTLEMYLSGIEKPTFQNFTTNKKISLTNSYNQNVLINTHDGKKSVTSLINVPIPSFFSYADVNDVTYSNTSGLFVAVGNGGKILTSKDGVKWIKVNTEGQSNSNLNSVCFCHSRNLLCAVGNGVVFLSSDGVTWEDVTITGNYVKVICNNETFIAVGSDGMATSSDGINWTYDDTKTGTDIAYSQFIDKYIFASSNGIEISEDLETWTTVSAYTGKIALKEDVPSNETPLFMVVSSSGIITSTDGETWSVVNNNVYSWVMYDKFKQCYFVVGNGVYSTTDGTTVEAQTIDTSAGDVKRIYYFDLQGIYICLCNDGVTSSTDFTEWSDNVASSVINNAFVINDKYFAIGNKILVSDDGQAWTEVYSGVVDLRLQSMCYSRSLELYVAVGTDEITGYLLTSSDGIEWTQRNIPACNSLYDIVYAENKGYFVAVGGVPYTAYIKTCIISYDGILWEDKSDTASSAGRHIIYSEDKELFVLATPFGVEVSDVGYDFTDPVSLISSSDLIPLYNEKEKKFYCFGDRGVYQSIDGINWSYSAYDLPDGISSLNFNLFVKRDNTYYGNGNGKFLVSNDGIKWETEGDFENYIAVAYSERDNNFVFLSADSGTVYTTEKKGEENLIADLTNDSNMYNNLEVGDNEIIIYGIASPEFRSVMKYRQRYAGV